MEKKFNIILPKLKFKSLKQDKKSDTKENRRKKNNINDIDIITFLFVYVNS